MEVQPREICNYLTPDAKSPFEDWLESLRDTTAKAKIDNRIRRIRLGNMGDCKSLADGVYQLRINYGPGYRVYFGEIGSTVVLLCGGDKSTQAQDISQAKKYWADYERSKNAK